jgi:hypothetical protein
MHIETRRIEYKSSNAGALEPEGGTVTKNTRDIRLIYTFVTKSDCLMKNRVNPDIPADVFYQEPLMASLVTCLLLVICL